MQHYGFPPTFPLTQATEFEAVRAVLPGSKADELDLPVDYKLF
jgi:hypothetical protein